VNTLVYSYLRIFDLHERADQVKHEIGRFTITNGTIHHHVHEGLVVKHKPYYAFWSYKIHSSKRFDLLGNSLAILFGIASPSRADEMISWIEEECFGMKDRGELAVDLPPNFFPYIKSNDPDWMPRYEIFNEWIKAQDGKQMGQDWQTWSAAMYLYAAKCVEEKCTPYFDQIRNNQ